MKENKIALSRAVRINLEDLTKFGLMRGCPQFRSPNRLRPRLYIEASLNKVQGKDHGELAITPEGSTRIAAAAERLDKTGAEL